ncbi:hypothetical protein M6B38_154570 [Iris pallida]|uniref:Uncharacterized protein n=1 Tax=Iris pallida TaxID=29817 RepID=A0AAX6F506_IRIPA|nr:hypothetical protein M6B38_154570 [Iris pallida]
MAAHGCEGLLLCRLVTISSNSDDRPDSIIHRRHHDLHGGGTSFRHAATAMAEVLSASNGSVIFFGEAPWRWRWRGFPSLAATTATRSISSLGPT